MRTRENNVQQVEKQTRVLISTFRHVDITLGGFFYVNIFCFQDFVSKKIMIHGSTFAAMYNVEVSDGEHAYCVRNMQDDTANTYTRVRTKLECPSLNILEFGNKFHWVPCSIKKCLISSILCFRTFLWRSKLIAHHKSVSNSCRLELERYLVLE